MLWSEGASRPGGADAGGNPWPWRLWKEGHERETHQAFECTPDGTTVAQRGSQEYDGRQEKPPELRA